MGVDEHHRVVPGHSPDVDVLPEAGTHDADVVYNAKGVPPPGKSVFEIEPEDDNLSPIEEVNLTVPTTDDPTLPVWTFRMWAMGIFFCALLSFLNQFFYYRTEPLLITAISAQVVAMPLGRLMAKYLPTRVFLKNSRFAFSLNPGPWNMKEHVLVTIFANSGAGTVYAVDIVTIVRIYYHRQMTFFPSLLICLATQMLGYGFAGVFRDYVVKPGVMWWPINLVQVSLFRALHESDKRPKYGYTRLQCFILVMTVSFAWYTFPGFLFSMFSSLSWVCWAWPNSVLAHQLGSGLHGLGIGAVALDWTTVASYLINPLASPWFSIANVAVGFFFVMYVLTPICYWANIYNAKTFPIFSSHLYRSTGEVYDITEVVSSSFTLDEAKYQQYGKVHLSTFFAMTYGVGFASLTATITHVTLFYGRDIWRLARHAVKGGKDDVHTRLMSKYKQVPQWWFIAILVVMVALSLGAVVGYKDQLQLPWWGVLLATALAFVFTLPLAIIYATTNQLLGLNVITEYLMGYIYPGRPVANVAFKTYGYISMYQAVTFLADLKLGHYMKIPPIAMFVAQVVGTLIATFVYLGTAWWLLQSIAHICNGDGLLSDTSQWTCPQSAVFFDASVIWGLVGPKKIFGPQGIYQQINWWFLVGAVAPIPVWIATKVWPNVKFFRLINMPILIGATGLLPPATSVNFTMWIFIGFIFQYVVFNYRKRWWAKYNYVVAAGLDSGLAFMAILIYFTTGLENIGITWWGSNLDNCPLATCPTQKGLGQPNPDCPPT